MNLCQYFCSLFQILLVTCFMGVSRAVFIDTGSIRKDLYRGDTNSWQEVKMYPSSSQAYGNKYEPYVSSLLISFYVIYYETATRFLVF